MQPLPRYLYCIVLVHGKQSFEISDEVRVIGNFSRFVEFMSDSRILIAGPHLTGSLQKDLFIFV